MRSRGRAKSYLVVAGIGAGLIGAVAAFAAMAAPLDDAPGPGPGPECDLPPARCEGARCAELIRFTPAVGPGYEDYPYEGETWDDQYASYIRRDLMVAIQYAAAKVACKSSDWRFGNGGPIVLLDMSEQDGAIPGTSRGAPGHPPLSHLGGRDIDLAYYQVNTPDNRVRPVCRFEQAGMPVHHCVGPPTHLDPWRTALFIGVLFEQPGIRVVGVDGRIGPILRARLERLAQDGWLTRETVARTRLVFETQDVGLGWYHFHYNHMHVSVDSQARDHVHEQEERQEHQQRRGE
jgi:hypothetical protein